MEDFTWCHAVIKTEGVYQFVEAEFYNGEMRGYSEPFMNSETLEGMQLLINRLQKALDEYKESEV